MQVPAVLKSARLWVLAGLLLAAAAMMREERARQDLSGLVIAEVMAANTRGLTDEDGDTSDWIELFNRGPAPVELAGLYLTDDRGAGKKWPLPEITLGPGQARLVFASGKDRREGELHASFRLDDQGEFLGLVGPEGELVFGFEPELPAQHPNVSFGLASGAASRLLVGPESEVRLRVAGDASDAASWTLPGFDDAAWRRGRGGVGFERGYRYESLIGFEAEGMYRKRTSAYLRIPFDVADPAAISRLTLRLRYDDGFIAYLNGRRVAADNAPDDPAWDARASASRPDEEAMLFASFDLGEHRSLLVEGENVLAIHGLNRSRKSKDFLVAALLEAFVGDPALGDEPVFLERPTPGRLNGTGFAAVAEPPRASPGGGLYFGSVEVAIESSPGAEVRYTLDGTLPDRSSPRYERPLVFDRSTILSARRFAPDRVPSEPAIARYVLADPELRQAPTDLPVVLLETFGAKPDANAFLPAYLHVFGDDGAPIERPSFSGTAAVKHRGSTTLRFPKRSFAVELRDQLGRDRAAPLLGMPADSDWVLYAPYNYDRSLIRNALIYELSNRIGRYAPRTRFVELYRHTGGGRISLDDYFGVYVATEKIKRGAHRVDVEELPPSARDEPRIAGGYILKIDRKDPGDRGFEAGGQRRLNHVYPKEARIGAEQARWIRSYLDDFGRALDEGGYEQLIDVDSWIDHHILQELSRNPDGHRYSTFLHKRRAGKLEMGPVWDFDRAMGADDTQRSRTAPSPHPIGRSRVHSYGWWERLMADPELVRRYRERWIELRRGPLATQEIERSIAVMEAQLAPAAGRNFARWPVELGARGWEGKIAHLRAWITTRARWMDGELIGPPQLHQEAGPASPARVVDLLPAAGGEIFYTLDGSDPRAAEGGVGATARAWTGPLEMPENALLSARERVTQDVWGGLIRERYGASRRSSRPPHPNLEPGK